MHRIFILSPANVAGERARFLMNKGARFELARRLQSGPVPLGEIFSFLSGLYFRGKLAYAKIFARPPQNQSGIWVITTNRGLLPADTPIALEELKKFSRSKIDERNWRYRKPLERDAMRLAAKMPANCEVVLLGSIATGKYLGVLQASFGPRLRYPAEFIGRGDMSRGGLMLRSAADGRELIYYALTGESRRGKRPGKLPPRRYTSELGRSV